VNEEVSPAEGEVIDRFCQAFEALLKITSDGQLAA
jgi:hypothetical protein